jgi:precorrin-2/cobalt-factor-2 C20-methyltransferase
MADPQAMVKPGTLYGVGVGPGDPELMTVKAWRLVATAPVVAYLTADGRASTARAIAAPFIAEGTIELAIPVPMRPERAPAQEAYDEGAAALAEHLKAGRDVAMLCEGDPFFYGSFMYLYARLAQNFATVVVPGVTSLTAAAAAIGRPLAARDEVLKVLPATLDGDRLREELLTAESVAIVKVGRHFGKVRDLLGALDLGFRALIVERATDSDQRIARIADIPGDSLPYFATILVYAGKEPW